MRSLTVDLPAMYADHHVIEVRRLVSELPGVGAIYASSAFHFLEIEYDPQEIEPGDIEAALAAAGYLEAEAPPSENDGGTPDRLAFKRHTAAYAQAGRTVSFAQPMPYRGRPLWPCPGIGVIRREEKDHA